MSVGGTWEVTIDRPGGADTAGLARLVAPINRTCRGPAMGIFLSADRG
jgi:hypothetical protein